MGRPLKYAAGLIALYLFAAYATNFGQLVGPVGGAAGTLVRDFQGR